MEKRTAGCHEGIPVMTDGVFWGRWEVDAVVDDIHVSQVVDLSATEAVAKDGEDKKGPFPSMFSFFLSFSSFF